MSDPYSTNPLSYAFWANQPTGPGGYDALQARRKIAEGLLTKRSPFPQDIGQGLTYLGERISDRRMMNDLANREAADEARQEVEKNLFIQGARRASGLAEADTGTPTDQTATAPNPVRDQIATVMTPPPQVPADQGRIPLPPPRPVYDRNRQIAELQANPALQNRILTIAKGEVGDNPQAQQIIAETIMNRAAARDQPLEQVTRQYTGPGSTGYYPASTFGRGSAPPDILSPVLRGSDAGGQAFGFAPTGNASGGVASRGVASGRYNVAGQLPGSAETYVQQERPDQLARLAATRLGGGGGGSPPTMTDIPSAPPGAATAADTAQTAALAAAGGRATDIPSAPPPTVLAQAGAQPPAPAVPAPASRYGSPPGTLEPRPPQATPPSAGGTQQPAAIAGLRPAPVIRPMGEQEIQALAIAKSSRDLQTRDRFNTLAGMYAAQRQAEFDRKKLVWDAEARTHEALTAKQYEAGLTQGSEKYRQELADAQEKSQQEKQNRDLGGTLTEATTNLEKRYEKVEPLLSTTDTLRQAKAAAKEMFAGVGAPTVQKMQAYIGSLPGGSAFVAAADKGATAGQLFSAYMRQVLAPMRTNVTGVGSTSNFDLENLLTAAGANPSLQRGAINQLLDHAADMNFQGIKKFAQQRSSYAVGDPNSDPVKARLQTLNDRFPLDLEEHVPDYIVENFRNNYKLDPRRAMNEVDEGARTPGLAAKLIEKYKIGQ
jgi:hypothetical protein